MLVTNTLRKKCVVKKWIFYYLCLRRGPHYGAAVSESVLGESITTRTHDDDHQVHFGTSSEYAKINM